MIDLDFLKTYLRVDHDAEDAILLHLLQAATDAIESELRRPIEIPGQPIPPALRHAVLMLTAYYYEHREAASEAKLEDAPFAIRYLISPHKRLLMADGSLSPSSQGDDQ